MVKERFWGASPENRYQLSEQSFAPMLQADRSVRPLNISHLRIRPVKAFHHPQTSPALPPAFGASVRCR